MNLPTVLLQLSTLLAMAVVVGIGAKRIRMPLTVVLAALGLAANTAFGPLQAVEPLRGETFEQVLVFLFLPALVFSAVLGLSVRSFLRNLTPILALATVAFAVSAILVGVAVGAGLGVPLTAALLFGALISATDPVAVVAVFHELGVPRRLLTLVEGESLLNDGVAIVLFELLLVGALGGQISVVSGAVEFIAVFAGGAAIGAAVGFAAAVALPWLDRLSAGALSVAVAYGSFVLSDHVLHFSGVVATATAGLVMAGLAPSRASADVRNLWQQLWESIDYIANALLFLLIGLVIEPALLREHVGPIALAIVAVLVARPLGVIPVVTVLERVARIPRVGQRNEAILIWGGLRGGVALALALALPESLAQRDLFIAMTAGVVLTTLLINATTIGPLVSRLGLNSPGVTDRFLAAWAQVCGVKAARKRLTELGIDNRRVSEHLDRVEATANATLAGLDLDATHEEELVTTQGLLVERETYQRLSDTGLLPPPVTRTLLREVDDQVDEVTMGSTSLSQLRSRTRSRTARLGQRVASALPSPAGERPDLMAYAEASARRIAAERTAEALDTFAGLPNISSESVNRAKQTFASWERDAVDELHALADESTAQIEEQQAEALSRAMACEEVEMLVDLGLLPAAVAERAQASIERELGGD